MKKQNESLEKSLEYYVGLSYPVEIQKAHEGGFVVSIPDLPGCIMQVENWEEAESSIEEVRKVWLRAAYEDGVTIPLPKTEKEYSGKFVLRIPKSIHRNLDKRAEDEGVSLNALLISMISQSLSIQKIEKAPSVKGSSQTWKDKKVFVCDMEKLMNAPSINPNPTDRAYMGGRGK